MKIIVLEHPRIPSKTRFNDIAGTPLWSCLMGGYAASSLHESGFETLFIDDAQPGVSFEDTREKIQSFRPDLLCVNAVYFWEHTPRLFEFLSGLKECRACGHINLFGFFPSLVYQQILSEVRAVDSIAVGEFEQTLVELAQCLDAGGGPGMLHPEKIKGLALPSGLNDGRDRMRIPCKDPDVFAFPKRSCLKGTVSILGSRGCYNHCSFCPVPSFYNQGRLWRGRSPENIAKEMQTLKDQGVTSFYFCDPNFIGPGAAGKKRILTLMKLIAPMHIRFGMETRPQDLDDELLQALVEAGFESLLMGVESGSNAVLKQMDKHLGPDQAARAIALCRRYGIEPEIGFLMFVPNAGLADLRQNMAFLMENRLLDRLDRTANLLGHTQIVLAGTAGYQRFEKEGRLKKISLFGFEAAVSFLDPAVEWVAHLMTFACRVVLKSMSDKDSVLYWKKEKNRAFRAVNDYLVTLFFSLMDQAGMQTGTMAGSDRMNSLENEIKIQIKALTYKKL